MHVALALLFTVHHPTIMARNTQSWVFLAIPIQPTFAGIFSFPL